MICLICSSILTIGCGVEPDPSSESWVSEEGQSQIGGADGKLVLRRKAVKDPVKQNMTSHTIFVPEGWEMTGETKWPHPYFFRMLPSPKIVVSSPDGAQVAIHRTGLYSDPRPSAEYRNYYGIRRLKEQSNDGGSLVLYRPDSFQEWKSVFREKIIPERHPNATNIRIIKVSECEEISQALIKNARPMIAQVQQANQMARSFGMPEPQSISIQALTIEATFEENGVKKEFLAMIGVHSIETRMQGLVQVRWSAEPNISYTAPYGELEAKMPVLVAITGTMRPTKSWVREVQRHIAANQPRNAPRPVQSSVNVGNTFSEILDISHKGFRKRSNMTDTGQRKYVNSIHQTADYSSGGMNYHLPAGYDHVYTDDNDTIILTNDSLFNPNVELSSSQNWTKMSER